MQTVPAVKVTRFAKIDSGDLFIYRHAEGSSIATVAEDPTQNGEKLLLPLGPVFPRGVNGPRLIRPGGMTVISFGKEYVLRLPVQTSGWLDALPPPEKHCILVTEQATYFRANFSHNQTGFSACYVDIATGLICTSGSGASEVFATPQGIPAFAIEWAIVTNEREPRVILAYPYPA